MNWTNLFIWSCVAMFWSYLFSDVKTAMEIVAITWVWVVLLKLDLWVSKKFEERQ